MSGTWAVCVPVGRAESIGPLRRAPGVDVCEVGQTIWLRATNHDENVEKAFLALPGRRFEVLPDGQLVPAGARVPLGHLPEGPWMAVSDWMSVETRPASLAAEVRGTVTPRLVRGGAFQEANLLLTASDTWSDYACAAPQIRLDRWAFATDDQGHALIRGTPLPPLPGTRFVERDGIAVPAGWTWQPAVDACVVRSVLGLEGLDVGLFHADGSWHHVRADDFVRASRSAVRLTTGRAV